MLTQNLVSFMKNKSWMSKNKTIKGLEDNRKEKPDYFRYGDNFCKTKGMIYEINNR